jgi:Ran GTPase-activating protein (RanGAP) involved in mRNA processing and transport
MVIMLDALQQNTTPFEYNCTGLELPSVKCTILARNIAYNHTLLSIDMCRKSFNDSDGQQLAKMLLTNKCLRKLELEGNLLGPKSAIEFGEALKHNTTLKYLNLESNQLTVDGQEMYGIIQMFEFLQFNSSLLSLNMANN